MRPADLLERTQWDFFWVPQIPGAEVVDRPEIAYVHGTRDLIYTHAVTRIRASQDRLPALVDEVLAAHAGFRSRWQVPDTVDAAPVERALARVGYHREHEHVAVCIGTDRLPPRPTPGIVAREVVDMAGLRDCYAVQADAFGSSDESSDEELARSLVGCTGASRTRRYVAYDASGRPLSAGCFNHYPDLGIGFLWGGGTVTDGRGRGAYSAVLQARVDALRLRGIPRAGLYAREGTSAPIVLARGFQAVGRMTHWERAP